MENYIVKVIIETATGKKVKEAEFNTANIAEIKAFGQTSIVDKFIDETLTEIRDDRRSNPQDRKSVV